MLFLYYNQDWSSPFHQPWAGFQAVYLNTSFPNFHVKVRVRTRLCDEEERQTQKTCLTFQLFQFSSFLEGSTNLAPGSQFSQELNGFFQWKCTLSAQNSYSCVLGNRKLCWWNTGRLSGNLFIHKKICSSPQTLHKFSILLILDFKGTSWIISIQYL